MDGSSSKSEEIFVDFCSIVGEIAEISGVFLDGAVIVWSFILEINDFIGWINVFISTYSNRNVPMSYGRGRVSQRLDFAPFGIPSSRLFIFIKPPTNPHTGGERRHLPTPSTPYSFSIHCFCRLS
ncbi:hypothetical protein L1887_09171 [Cichorium endivia]|nr:hypothetical protein L1887_09171 [Cichorium endivia]